METSGGKTIAYVFVKNAKAGTSDGAGRRAHAIDKMIENDLHFILGPALGIILIFFVFFFQPFA
jgi:hypothetical protein